jgi:hypothetical protein
VGPRKTPQELAVPAVTYSASPRGGVLLQAASSSQGPYPTVHIASGSKLPAKAPDGKLAHVPYQSLLTAEGAPKPAKELWSILTKAGVPRYAQIICVADDPGEAAVTYYVLKLMGFPDVKLQTSS